MGERENTKSQLAPGIQREKTIWLLLEKKTPDLAGQSLKDESGTVEQLKILHLLEMGIKDSPLPGMTFISITICTQPRIGGPFAGSVIDREHHRS